eukprot:gb/GECH01013641.1/.p1 GENE.gb/GECH01013641.1/~~gb/GECH01013641.1/.p1  ORF type:complete len:278 (+),score=52.17 gb/GECH01013641.1/:1-834(+)
MNHYKNLPSKIYFIVFIVLGLFSWIQSDTDINDFYEGKQEGLAFYTNPNRGVGACSFADVPAVAEDRMLIGISRKHWMNSLVCGMCIEISASGSGTGSTPLEGNFTAFIWDVCPRCDENGVDIPKNGDGEWEVSWRAVPCETNGTELEYTIPEGLPKHELKILIRNLAMPLKSVSFKLGEEWLDMERTTDNHFLRDGLDREDIRYPIELRMETIDGRTIEDEAIKEGKKPGDPVHDNPPGLESSEDGDGDANAGSSVFAFGREQFLIVMLSVWILVL